MPGEIVHKEIGSTTFHMEPLGAKAGQRILLRIGKTLADLFAARDLATLQAAIVSAIKGMSEADFDHITAAFADATFVDFRDPNPANGSKAMKLTAVYDSQFAGHYECLVEWVRWGLEVNFGSFFVEARALMSRAEASPSSSPPAATGTFGASS